MAKPNKVNSPRRPGVLFPAFLFVAMSFLISCRETHSGILKGVAVEVRPLTIPGDSTNLQETAIEGGPWSQKISWEFDSKLSPFQYFEWADERLKGSFKRTQTSQDEAIFTRNLDGDAETVAIQTRRDGDVVHVRIKVSVVPD